MSQPDTTTNTTCAKCGTEIQPGVKFCPNCGRAANKAPSKVVAAAKQYGVALKDIALRLWAKAGSYKHGKALVVAGACIVVLVFFVPRVVPGILGLSALSGPKGTKIPRGEPAESMVEKIMPAVEKLSQEDRDLLVKWLDAHTVTVRQVNQARGSQGSSAGTGAQVGASVGGLFGALIGGFAGAAADEKRAEWAQSIEEKLANGVPRGMTIGKAIADQKKYEEKQGQGALDEKKLTAKLKAENEATIEAMRQAVTFKLTSKKKITVREDWITKDYLVTTLVLQNNSGKDISGVKGKLAVVDQFGNAALWITTDQDKDNLVYQEIVKAGGSAEFSTRALIYDGIFLYNGRGDANRVLSMSDDQFKMVFTPLMVVFADGSKLIRKTDPDRDIRDEVENTITKNGHTLNEIYLSDRRYDKKYSFETQETYKKQYAERRAAMEEMRQTVPVRLLSKKIVTERGSWGSKTDYLVTNFVFQNNSGKDITGIKGNIRFEDQFGTNLLPDDSHTGWTYTDDKGQYVKTAIKVLIEKTVGTGTAVEWSHKGFAGFRETIKMFASMKDYQFRLIWEPETVVFADGTKIDAPPEPPYEWVLASKNKVYGATKH